MSMKSFEELRDEGYFDGMVEELDEIFTEALEGLDEIFSETIFEVEQISKEMVKWEDKGEQKTSKKDMGQGAPTSSQGEEKEGEGHQSAAEKKSEERPIEDQ
ncbi:hypothetical protein QA612_17870 [Evansella sp. AB-P1]|uniref:hypothetical protein n=1 Tax=Evansella sp. AB-P1 TaxID=3037653 RepID=UPI00241CB3F8|nr:hypothetical protein [Evansella sp. AB-P1]MDG5789332.1 hypothetical protein [Evansella sp. AB-P1]